MKEKKVMKNAKQMLTTAIAAALSLSLLAACVPTEGTGDGTDRPDDNQTTEGETTLSNEHETSEPGDESEDDNVQLPDSDLPVNLMTRLAAHLELDSQYDSPETWLGNFGSEIDAEQALLNTIVSFSQTNFSILAENQAEENVLFSPLSLYVALSMLGEGTAGETREQIETALAGTDGDASGFLENTRPLFSNLLAGMNTSVDKFIMMAGQSIWMNPSVPFRQSYLDILENDFYTEAYLADFAGDPDAVKAEMGEWVSDKTNGLLGDDLPIDISPQDVFYLIQSLYFKDSWLSFFQEENTVAGAFTKADGSTQETEFMHQNILPSSGVKTDDFLAAELMTEQGFSFRVILPNETLTLDETLGLDRLYDVLYSDHLQTQNYEASPWSPDWHVFWEMPKFDVQGDIDLMDLLQKQGITEVMGSQADFSNAADVEAGTLFLDQAKQQVRVKVDEKGVEAAAVTLFAMTVSMPLLQGELHMTLNRPFLFSIVTATGMPLFMGWVGDVAG